MKRLILMRHAKSDWSAGADSDHERPLNHRGKREAPVVAAELRASGLSPDRVISSDSTRTRETWERMEDQFPSAVVTFDPTLYLAGIEAARAALRRVDADAAASLQTVMLLGHNPGWEDMVSDLSGQRVELKTAHAAVFEATADRSWVELLEEGAVRLARIVTAGD